MTNVIPFPRLASLNGNPKTFINNLALSSSENISFANEYHLYNNEGDWTNQELAELYRVEAILLQSGITISTDRGTTDENDPWFVFCREDGDVFLHLARIDGSYLLHGYGMAAPLLGPNFKTLVRQFIENNLGDNDQNDLLSLRTAHRYNDVIRLHPLVMFAALAWTLYLSSDQWITVAYAKDDVSKRAFDTYTSIKRSINSDDKDYDPIIRSDNDSPLDDTDPSGKPHTKDINSNFNIFLAIHGIAIGSPLVVWNIDSTTFVVPHLSAEEIQSTNSNISTSKFFEKFSDLGLHVSEKHGVDRDIFITTPAADINKSDAGSNSSVHAEARAFFQLEQSTKHHFEEIYKEDNGPTKPLNIKNIDLSQEDNNNDKVYSSNQSDISDIISKIMSDHADVNNFDVNGVLIKTTLQYKELFIIISHIYEYIDNKDIFSYFSELEKTTNEQQINQLENTSDKNNSVSIGQNVEINTNSRFQTSNTNFDNSPVVSAPTVSAAVADTPASVAKSTTSTENDATSHMAPQITKGATYGYSAAAGTFLTHLVGKSDDVEMLQIGNEVVIIDMSSIDELSDKPLMVTWVTDAGLNISTIGHSQDFSGFGLS